MLTCCVDNLKPSRKRGGSPARSASQIVKKTAPLEKCSFIGVGLRVVCLALRLPTRYTKSSIFKPVAQNFPTTAQVIYDTLSNDTEFMSLLGTYEFRAGQTMPAISVTSAGADLPALRNVQGVECIIHDAGSFTTSPYITNDEARVTATWSVFLVSWEPSTGSDLQAAAERACSRFYGSSAVQTVATTDGLGSLVQTKLQISSDMPIIG